MPRRPVQIPLYALLVLVFAAVSGPPLSIYASVQIAETQATELVRRYEVDQAASEQRVATEKARQAEENRTIYCVLFTAQIDAFEEATSPAGEASYRAWLAVHKLARCQPERK